MTSENNRQNEKFFCPWMREECAEGKCLSTGEMRCRLWSQILTLDGRLGVPKPVFMCVFQAQLLIQGTPRPEMQTIPVSRLKIN